MIERPAGPHSQVSAQFKAAGQSAGVGFDVWIDQDKYTPALRAETSLPPNQLEPLLKRMVGAQSARFRSSSGDERCHRHYTWAWTGSTFMLAHDSIAPLCRGLPQGGYPLQLFTASESAQ